MTNTPLILKEIPKDEAISQPTFDKQARIYNTQLF